MAKANTLFVCRDCGNEFPRWSGKCEACGAWNTLEEFKVEKKSKLLASSVASIQINNLNSSPVEQKRIVTGIGELDRVFGGGFMPGSLVLLSGEPGIGKSTLLLQVIGKLALKQNVLYWSAEESQPQILNRAKRLKLNVDNIDIVSTTDASVLAMDIKASVVIVDSIQTVADPNIESAAGSVTQVRAVLQSIQVWAKEKNKLVIVVGHVTKDGVVAGPKTLEHLVDVVTILEGDPNHDIRLLRGTKNRFGPTNEIGVFSMKESGLEEISNPSKLFLQERLEGVPGSIITATLEGSRPLLVEVQALVTKTYLTFPRRTASGIDPKRLDLIIAILENRVGIKLYDQDIFLNIVGGIKIVEPAIDLAIALSIVSAFWKRSVPANLTALGEIGLAGELRSIKGYDLRQREITRLGYKLLPKVKTLSQAVALIKK